MFSVSNVSFQASGSEVKSKNKTSKKEVVYVSKNPDRAVDATGVVAGSAGMIGGAVLGGTIGLAKLPGEFVNTLASQKYGQAFKNAFNSLKQELKNVPELTNLVQTIKQSNSLTNSEEVLEILKTLTQNLHNTFAKDKEAKAVIDNVIDPVIKSLSLKKNMSNYSSILSKEFVKSPVGQTILKVLGMNKKTSNIIGDVIGNASKGISEAVINIKNFTPAEKEAWKKVIDQIGTELQKNPKIKVSTETVKGLKSLLQKSDWLIKPLEAFKDGINNLGKQMQSNLGKAPLKTIGLHSLYGAAACAAISLLGWFGMKHAILKKENTKLENLNSNNTNSENIEEITVEDVKLTNENS